MDANVFDARFRNYAPANAVEQELVLQEMLQCFVLSSLSRAGFFKDALFHGGTCLRIIHGIARFSEDLNFMLKRVNLSFEWTPYLDAVRKDCEAGGILFEANDRVASKTAVRKAWLKTDSIGTLLEFTPPYPRVMKQKIRIKLEIDTRPPAGSGFETHYLSFPTMSALTVQDLPSSFATKAHALLCRSYTKGRDWYDFLWFVSRRVRPRLDVLANALDQQGPWAGQGIDVTADWFVAQMRTAVAAIDWPAAIRDVERFLPLREQESLALWNAGFFLYHVDRMADYLTAGSKE